MPHTDRKHNKLSDELALLQRISQTATWSSDPAGNLLPSSSTKLLFGRLESAEDNTWSHIDEYEAGDRNRHVEAVMRALGADTRSPADDPVEPFTFAVSWPDSTVRQIEETITRSTDADGHPIAIGALRDVTEQHADRTNLSMLNAVVDSINASIYVRDREGRVVWANRRTAEFNGVDHDQIVGMTLHDIVPSNVADEIAESDKEFYRTGGELVEEHNIPRLDGSTVVGLTVKSGHYDHDGNLIGTISMGRDISDLWQTRQRLEQQLAENARYRTVIETMPELVYAKDADGSFTLKNRAFEQFERFLATVNQNDRAHVTHLLEKMEQQVRPGIPTLHELTLPTPSHGDRFHLATLASVGDANGLAVIVQDLDHIKALELELRAEADLDPLTGLLNRRAIHRVIENERRSEGDFSIIMLDLDHFKQINDTHGHPLGDEVLVEVARRVSGCLRPADALSRWGGEEFLISLPGVSLDDTAIMAARVHAAIAQVEVPTGSGQPIQVSASVGYGSAQSGEPSILLIERVDAALYKAKELGRDRIVGTR